MKVEHSIGGHDDSLFSYLIGLYTLTYGKNLNKFLLNRNVPNPKEDRADNIRRSVDFMNRMQKSNAIAGTFSKSIVNDFKDINTSPQDVLNKKYNIYNNFIGNKNISNDGFSHTDNFNDIDEVINKIEKYIKK